MEEDKKADRKRKRFAARLYSSKGIVCTDTPGPYIVLCNVGQATGLEKDTLYNLIKDNLDIPVPKYIAEKGESHSFLVFKDTANAVLFYNTYNGKAKADENGTPLYMNYVEKVPIMETVCPHGDPEGLTLLNNFISEEEEIQFLEVFDWTSIDSNLKNRQVKHYGYEFRYGTNDVDLTCPLDEKIPQQCDILWRRLRENGIDIGIPDQLTVNKYLPGQGIPSHVDKHSPFGDTILSLSLGSAVVMEWKHHSGKFVPILVEPRSLLLMQGEARYDWQHGIQPRTWDPIIQTRMEDSQVFKVITTDTVTRQTRISLTFRWTRSGKCQCRYKTLCDSVDKVAADDLEDSLASNLEDLHVHQVYEQIAGHFSRTRHRAWPRVHQFVTGAPLGGLLLDLGAGNGKNILPGVMALQIACERSAGLLAECQRHVRGVRGAGGVGGAECVRLDLLSAGLRDDCADVVLCIAVVHHFCTKARRLQAISTIHRLLRPGGLALITVWAKDQTKSNYLVKNKLKPAEEVQINISGVNLPVHENRTQFQHKDLLVPWKLKQKSDDKLVDKAESTLFRYYHVFEEGELDELCRDASLEVEETFYEEGNWCVICKKM